MSQSAAKRTRQNNNTNDKHMPYKDPEAQKEYYRRNNIASANKRRKSECKRYAIPYDLTNEYLLMLKKQTPHCCITGQVIDYETCERYTDAKANLDRIIPANGYIKGNVRWVSAKANRMKQEHTTETLLMLLADNLRVSRAELDESLSHLLELRNAVEKTESTAHYEG